MDEYDIWLYNKATTSIVKRVTQKGRSMPDAERRFAKTLKGVNLASGNYFFLSKKIRR